MVKNKKNIKDKKIKIILLIGMLVIWELSGQLELVTPMLLPPFSQVIARMINELIYGSLVFQLLQSIGLILLGIIISLVLSMIMVYLDYFNNIFKGLFELLASIFHPLPGIALLPVIMIWFGVGLESVLIVVIHAIVWSLYLNLKMGIESIDKSLVEVAHNNGANSFQLFIYVLIPSIKNSFLVGMQIGWSRGWRGLISAEMVFGAISALGGIGWFMYERRSFMDITGMYSGILIVVLLGIVVEEIIFNNLINQWYKS